MSKSTVIVSRQFRGTQLYLTHAKACEFAWSNDRAKALPVSVRVAARIIQDLESFERGTGAFAVDKAGSVLVYKDIGITRTVAKLVPRIVAQPADTSILAQLRVQS